MSNMKEHKIADFCLSYTSKWIGYFLDVVKHGLDHVCQIKGDKLIVHLTYDTYAFMAQVDTEKDTKQEINHLWLLMFF